MDLNYNTMDLGYQFSQKNSRSSSENPDLVREKIFKEIDLGRVAGPFWLPSDAYLSGISNFSRKKEERRFSTDP